MFSTMNEQALSRREAIVGAGALAALAGLAGCSGDGGGAGSMGVGDSGSAAASDDLLAQIQERGSMTFATEGTWSPWTFHNEAGGAHRL